MKSKLIRLGKAIRYELVRRLPWVMILLIFIGGWAAWQSYNKTAEGVRIAKSNTDSIKQLGEDNKILLEQNKALSEQNNTLAKENARHIDCIAAFFAIYTQTGQPIKNVDLDTCIIPTGSGSSSATLSGGSSGSSSPKNAPSNNNSLPENSQTPLEEQHPPIATEPPDDSILPGNQNPIVGCVHLPFSNKLCL